MERAAAALPRFPCLPAVDVSGTWGPPSLDPSDGHSDGVCLRLVHGSPATHTALGVVLCPAGYASSDEKVAKGVRRLDFMCSALDRLHLKEGAIPVNKAAARVLLARFFRDDLHSVHSSAGPGNGVLALSDTLKDCSACG
ncbi:hypothetical protein NDU88_002230 [Pleurodeles waltl]|uniref:Uncharacterized protein n=1 Tax=Pleurodeles waltl TaxID=8319 RepID=A0AAV7SDR0_PLEWA|nr:hypothetical protein NDU88_002230 [Pleurodeles waltl]